jgi:6-phosphogluconolactonase (cycloisomerase 2 family)
MTQARDFVIACYTFGAGGAGRQIEIARHETDVGTWTLLTQYDDNRTIAESGLMEDPQSPSYLAWHPDGRHLYAAGEVPEGRVWALEYHEKTHRLGVLGSSPSEGAHPCHLAVDPSGTVLVTANYTSGTLAVHPIRPNGSLGAPSDVVQHGGSGPHPERQQGAHAHMVHFVNETLLLAVDLGMDAIAAYTLDLAVGRLYPAAAPISRMPAGFGPRHLVRLPNDLVAVVGELTGEIALARLNSTTGELIVLDVTAGTETEEPPSWPSGIGRTTDGRYVVMANRGPNTVASFRVLPGSGDTAPRLELVDEIDCGGDIPRDLAVVGESIYVANQESGSVTVLMIDPDDGELTATTSRFEVASPTQVLPVPTASVMH